MAITEIDAMEYSSDANAQAAYVTNASAAVSQQQTIANASFPLGDGGSNVEYRQRQSFQIQNSSLVSQIDILFTSNSGSPSGNVTCRIETDNAGQPSGTLVDSNATLAITPTASSWNAFAFTTPFNLTANITYWIVLNCDNQANDVAWYVMGSATSQYALGNRGYTQDGSWNNSADTDLGFKVYTLSLQCFSEATIKSQGSYALKSVAAITDSLNKTLTKTFASSLDLTGVNTLKFDMRASRTGANVKLGLHDTGGTTTELTPTINSADTYETKTWDISGVSDANKNAIDTLTLTQVNADSATTWYMDNFYGTTDTGVVFIPRIMFIF